MKIRENCLEATLKHLAAKAQKQFPESHTTQSFWKRYSDMADKLNAELHPTVQAGAASADGGLLTDHGPIHIKTVMNRAADLLDNPKNKDALEGYEIYLLLCAIHFHDLGNMLGRAEHEKKINQMMDLVKSHLGDSIEKKHIRQIAETHGGKVGNDPDTISHLNQRDTVFNKDVRPQAIAAILRFADELADDSQRANRVLQQLDAIPEGSEVFHKYAECLHSVRVRDDCRTVELTFDVNVRDLSKTFGKVGKSGSIDQVYILDEIFSRTLKMHLERVYCNRFMSPIVHINSIVVRIGISKDDEKVGDSLPTINYKLQDSGYPRAPEAGIHSIADELNHWGDTDLVLTGENFAKYLKQNDHTKEEEDA